MSFTTIAIIENNQENTYLVKLEDKQYSFWEFTNKGIGADFQRDLLDRKFEKEFSINLEDEIAEKFSEKEYEGKDSPPATVYKISLSQKGFQGLNDYLKKKETSIYHWISESELFKKQETWKKSQSWIFNEATEALNYKSVPKLNNSFSAKITQISKAKEEGNLVIFVGAGISKASGVPLWGELIDEMKKGIDVDENEFEIVPQLYYQEHGETNYYKKIGKILNINNVKPNIIHKEIFQLTPSHIITTNYDSLIEQEQDKIGTNYHIVSCDKDLPKSNSSNLIIKMHGDFETANTVLKENDYLLYSENFPLIENIIKGLFASKTILFIGFSFSDRNLKSIIHKVRHILQKKYNPVLLFNTTDQNKLDSKRLQYFKEQGVNVIGYETGMKRYLEHKKIFVNPKNHEERTAKTVNFLRFIKEYSNEDPFFFSEVDILDKMYGGLMPFQDLPSIPYNYLVKIKPFAYNDNTPAEYDHFGFHLKTANEEILRFLKDVEEIKNNTIIYNNGGKKEENKEVNKKLSYVFKKLHASGVLGIQRSKDFREKVQIPLKIVSTNEEKCQCSLCLFNRFEFDKAHIAIVAKEIDDKNPFFLIKRAKAKFFFSDYVSSYSDLKEAASIARSNSLFHIYFIALYNIKLLEYKIKGIFFEQVNKKTKERILNEIKSISLPSIIEKLYINQLSKDILHSIEKKEQYHLVYRQIRKNIHQIEKLHESHKDGTTQFSGPNYAVNLIYSYRIYYNFICNNLLFDVFYNNFQSLTNLFAKGLFISISSHKSLTQKIEFIDTYDILCILEFSNPKNLYDDIQLKLVNNGKQLKINKDGIVKIINLALAYVDSNIEINSFFRETITLNPELEYAKNKNFITEQRLRYLFDKILIIMSAASEQFLESDRFNELTNKILKYIIASNNQVFTDSIYFKGFIELVIKNDSNEQIKLLLNACISDNMWCEKNLRWFSNAIHNHKINFLIDDESQLQKIFLRTSKRDSFKLKRNQIFPLYSLVSPNLVHLFNKYISENFEDNENTMIKGLPYNISYPNTIITPEKKFVEICSMNPWFIEYGDKTILGHSQFFRFLFPFVKGEFKLTTESIAKISSYENIYSWLINPKSFDYSKFDIKWLDSVEKNKLLLEYLAKNSKSKLRKIIEKELKDNYSSELSEIYWTYFK